MTDRLSLTNALADANIDRQKAERIATEIFDAIHDNVATKADVDRLGTRIDQVETALGARIDQVESKLGARIDQVESRLRAEMREVELRLEARIDRIVVRLGSLIVILAGVILAAIRYLPRN
jgi:type II secretory pathway component PulK